MVITKSCEAFVGLLPWRMFDLYIGDLVLRNGIVFHKASICHCIAFVLSEESCCSLHDLFEVPQPRTDDSLRAKPCKFVEHVDGKYIVTVRVWRSSPSICTPVDSTIIKLVRRSKRGYIYKNTNKIMRSILNENHFTHETSGCASNDCLHGRCRDFNYGWPSRIDREN